MIRTKAMSCTEKFTVEALRHEERNNTQSALSQQIQRSLERLLEHRLITTGSVSFNIPLDSPNLRARQRN
jgi:hypothetical protein